MTTSRSPDPASPVAPATLSDRALLARLVSFDTVSRRPNAPAAAWIADYLDRQGLHVALQKGPAEGKVNLVARAGPEPEGDGPGEGLTLSGHLDVVPAHAPAWESDPFEMVEREGRYIGRGTCDMKGFCALAINRLARVDPARLACPLGLLLTFDEEIGCLGARHFVRHWPAEEALPRSVVVGEPTSLRAVRMHKGHLKLRITLRGRAAHTGTPHLGVNAVERAEPVLAALAALRRQLEAEPSEHAPAFSNVPHTVLAVTGIRGGEATNIVPARCEIDVGVRLMPGTAGAAVVERVRRAAAAAEGEVGVEVETRGESPPMLTPPEAPLHRTLCEMLGQRESLGAPFASDGGWLSTAGYECVLFGPGAMRVAHRPGEHLHVREFEAAGRHLDELIGRTCEAAGGPA